jgi:hypothetical protein
VSAAIAAAVMLAARRADADCAPSWTNARDAMVNYDLVFSGTIVGTGVPARFKVDRVWKGDVQQTFVLAVLPGEDMHDFAEGGWWVVFARLGPSVDQRKSGFRGSYAWVSICSPTRPLDDAAEVLKQLGPGRAPRR